MRGPEYEPPGSAALVLHARIAGLPPDAVARALDEDKKLVEVVGMRLSPHVVPAGDVAVFTRGALPATEESLLMPLSSPALKRAGLRATDALHQAADAACDELDGWLLVRGALSAALTRRLPEVLCPRCQGCGARHIQESLFRLVGVRGVFVIAFRRGKGGVYARTDQWLGGAPSADGGAARATLLRRYLRCFGPSTADHFAAWAGSAPADAQQSWDAIADHLVAVDLDGHPTWLHSEDVARLENPATPTGVRLLPPYDAYLDQRDRATILPDLALHGRVWKRVGNPGAVLVNGEVVGLWRPRKTGKRLVVAVEAFTAVTPRARAEIEAEAALLAPLRGCVSADIALTD